MKIVFTILLFMPMAVIGCSRFSYDYEDDEPVAIQPKPLITETMTNEQIIKALETVDPDIISINEMQWACCRDLCRGKPHNVAKEAKTEYIRCSCEDGRMFRVTRLRGKQ